jgi:hypothetical protein
LESAKGQEKGRCTAGSDVARKGQVEGNAYDFLITANRNSPVKLNLKKQVSRIIA